MTSSYTKPLRWILLTLGLLLVGLILFVYFWQQDRTSDFFFTYNSFRFERDQYGYKVLLYINNQNVPATIHLREDPRTLEDIPVEGNVQLLREKQQIYITFDPEANLTSKLTVGALEIDAVIDNPYLFNIPVSSSFTKPYLNNTVKTCEDANQTEGVLLFQLSDRTVVRERQGCIYLEGVTEDDFIRASDRLAYTLLKIMKP